MSTSMLHVGCYNTHLTHYTKDVGLKDNRLKVMGLNNLGLKNMKLKDDDLRG